MMRCTQCGRMRPMPQIRFVPDGKVPGTVSTPKHNAVCSKCLLSEKVSSPDEQVEQAAVVIEGSDSGKEVIPEDHYPF